MQYDGSGEERTFDSIQEGEEFDSLLKNQEKRQTLIKFFETKGIEHSRYFLRQEKYLRQLKTLVTLLYDQQVEVNKSFMQFKKVAKYKSPVEARQF